MLDFVMPFSMFARRTERLAHSLFSSICAQVVTKADGRVTDGINLLKFGESEKSTCKMPLHGTKTFGVLLEFQTLGKM